ncbi:MAG TPA: ferredoxin [Firmicutes bacterium]|nr:ferredoxin [Bacillota bacterium]
MAQVSVDKDLCIGCSLCTQICPSVFVMGNDDKAEVVPGADASQPCAKEAEESCPSSAIKVEA